MSGNHNKRLVKLEQDRRPAAKVLYVWRDRPGETTAQAIARSFPDGVPEGARLVIRQDVGRVHMHRLSRGVPLVGRDDLHRQPG